MFLGILAGFITDAIGSHWVRNLYELRGLEPLIEDVGFRGQQRVIIAKVPLRRMFGYATDLRSATQGRANYSMQFDSYDAWE